VRTQAVRKLPGVDSVEVTLNRELLVVNDFVHSLIRRKSGNWKGNESLRRPLIIQSCRRCGVGTPRNESIRLRVMSESCELRYEKILIGTFMESFFAP